MGDELWVLRAWEGMKRGLAACAVVSGAAALARRGQQQRLQILMYHGVLPKVTGPAAFGGLFLEAAAFARHMRHVARAFRVMSLDEAMARFAVRRPFPDRSLLVTFDDGYRNVLTTAWPILRQYRIPATVFLPAAEVDAGDCSWFDTLRVLIAECVRTKTTLCLADDVRLEGRLVRDPERAFLALSHRLTTLPPRQAEPIVAWLHAEGHDRQVLARYPEFAPASWEEWRSVLVEHGITIGSHGMRHRNLVGLSADAQLDELKQSRLRIEASLSRSCRAVAYPYGAWNDDVARAARLAGYRCAMTTEEGLNGVDRNPFALRRTMIGDHGDFCLFALRVSGLWQRLRVKAAAPARA